MKLRAAISASDTLVALGDIGLTRVRVGDELSIRDREEVRVLALTEHGYVCVARSTEGRRSMPHPCDAEVEVL